MKFNKIILTAFSGLLLSSCVDLNQEPESFLTPENIIIDTQNANALASGLYKDLWGWNYGFNCRSQILGIGADDIQTGSLSKRYAFGDELNFTESLFYQDTEDMWKNMFALIRSANTMIEALSSETELSETVKNNYLGEAYFLRGFAYFHLVRYFGDLPIFDDSTCSYDIYGNSGKGIVRADISDVYDLMIVPSMEKAIEYLPNTSRTSNNASVSVWAAKACMADIYLTMAGWPLKRTEYYEAAKNLTADIINNSPHKLVDTYEELWKEAAKSNNEEHIFALNLQRLLWQAIMAVHIMLKKSRQQHGAIK